MFLPGGFSLIPPGTKIPGQVKRTQDGIRDGDCGQIAEAIAALLKRWNKDYYRWKPEKAKTLVADLLQLVTEQWSAVGPFFGRSLGKFAGNDYSSVIQIFSNFEAKLGPVGAAKALNLLAPNFFPLWDNAIASRSGVLTSSRGYFVFMTLTADQVRDLVSKLPDGLDPLKTLDEYNYCKYTKGWMA